MNQNQHNDEMNQAVSSNSGPKAPSNVANAKAQICKFYKPDDESNRVNTNLVFRVSFAHVRASSDENQLACYFGSALSAYAPCFTPFVTNALEEHDITLNVIKLPSEANANAIDLNIAAQDAYNVREVHTLGGLCFMLLFMNVKKKNATFISKRVCALGCQFGFSKKRIEAIKMLFGFHQAKAIRNVLGSSEALRQEVYEYLIRLSDRDEAGIGMSMAHYVHSFCVPPKPLMLDYNQTMVFLSDYIPEDMIDDE